MKGSIFDQNGTRLYLTPEERRRFIEAANQLRADRRAFCLTLALTGCRISEALNLTVEQVDTGSDVIVFETLKRRRRGVFRMVPVPTAFSREVRSLQTKESNVRCWPWCRTTGYMMVKQTIAAAGIDGPYASPKGLRHAFAIHALSVGVPINLIQKWMGHSSIETTSIYLVAVGAEERGIAQRLWADIPNIGLSVNPKVEFIQ